MGPLTLHVQEVDPDPTFILGRVILFQPRTIASANRIRFLMFLQTPTKNVQELAKEEREQSETKLRAAIVTSEGAIPAVSGKWRDTWRATS